MAKLFPSREQIKRMKPQPTEGEAFLLAFLEQNFDDSCEVYFQSSLDGVFPDVILMRPKHGILIIEVKDWDLSIYRKDKNNFKNWILHTASQGDQTIRSPLTQVKCYKDLFYRHYARSLAIAKAENEKRYALISTAVFFYHASSQELTRFAPRDKEHVILFGRDDLAHKERFVQKINAMAPYLFSRPSRYLTDEICEEMRSILRPSKYFTQKLEDIVWTKDQMQLYSSCPGEKQKIRGEAGCGKTLTLAHRAIDAYKKTHAPVLILTFNITLCHYIHDTINQLRQKDPAVADEARFMDHFLIMHYHLFIILFCNSHCAPLPLMKKNKKDEKKLLDEKAVSEALSRYGGIYRTILVDEVQDFEKTWIDNIHFLLAEGGELVFFGDEEQNIYERKKEAGGKIPHRCYTGLKGNWRRIHGSFRVEGDIAYLARAFQKQFFPDFSDNKIGPAMDNLFHTPPYLSYTYEEHLDVEGIVRLVQKIMKRKKLHQDDICLLSNRVEDVRLVEQGLRRNDYPTTTTFETEEVYQSLLKCFRDGERNWRMKDELTNIRRTSKMRFWMESGKIKLSTIHSYKGWGIDTEILILDGRPDQKQRTESCPEKCILLTPFLVYTAITRAKKNLIIFNLGGEQYHEFFQKHICDHHYVDGVESVEASSIAAQVR